MAPVREWSGNARIKYTPISKLCLLPQGAFRALRGSSFKISVLQQKNSSHWWDLSQRCIQEIIVWHILGEHLITMNEASSATVATSAPERGSVE